MTFPHFYEKKWHETFFKSNVSCQILKFSDQWLKARSVNIEMSLWCLQILPKDERKQVNLFMIWDLRGCTISEDLPQTLMYLNLKPMAEKLKTKLQTISYLLMTVKPLQNKKGQKNLGYPRKSSPFIRKKTAFFSDTSNFFGPSYFEVALLTWTFHAIIQ